MLGRLDLAEAAQVTPLQSFRCFAGTFHRNHLALNNLWICLTHRHSLMQGLGLRFAPALEERDPRQPEASARLSRLSVLASVRASCILFTDSSYRIATSHYSIEFCDTPVRHRRWLMQDPSATRVGTTAAARGLAIFGIFVRERGPGEPTGSRIASAPRRQPFRSRPPILAL